jgi:hypothetical protein
MIGPRRAICKVNKPLIRLGSKCDVYYTTARPIGEEGSLHSDGAVAKPRGQRFLFTTASRNRAVFLSDRRLYSRAKPTADRLPGGATSR